MNFSISLHQLLRHLYVVGLPVFVDLFVLLTSKTIWTTFSRGRRGPGMSFGAATFLITGIGLVLYGLSPLVGLGAASRSGRTPTDAEQVVGRWLLRGMALVLLYGWAFHIVRRFL